MYLSNIKDHLHTIQPYWKPAVGFTGVAILVAAVWGRIAVIGFGLASVALFAAWGPSIRVMSWVDLKDPLVACVILGNSYYNFVNPHWVNVYVVFCLLSNRYNFWSTYNKLANLYETLQTHNSELKRNNEEISRLVTELRAQFDSLSQQVPAAAAAQHAFNAVVEPLRSSVQTDFDHLKTQLESVLLIAQSMSSDEAFQQRLSFVRNLESKVGRLHDEHTRLQQLQRGLITDFTALRLQLQTTQETLTTQEGVKADQIAILRRAIESLTNQWGAIV